MAEILGTAGADSLRGTGQSDTFFSDTGPDTLSGGKGNDTVSGGGGDDFAKGGVGDDVLYGYSSADLHPNSGAIQVVQVGSGLNSPVFAMSAPGDPNRLFVVEQHTGDIEILDLTTGTLSGTAFLNIDDGDLATGGEQGLLGFAFAPDYETSGKVYVDLTNADGDIEIREYTRDGLTDQVDPDSMRILLTIEHSAEDNHNGGWIGFGDDDYLYVTVGDGGGGGDTDNSAQNLNALTGKILRLDVLGAPDAGLQYAIPDDNPFADGPGRDEIWAYGLRNPWRMSFDTLTGDAYIADVGQNAWEEIDFIEGGSAGGQNFGWHVKEGDHVFDDNTPGNPDPDDPSLVDPLVEYEHLSPPGPFGGNVVTGGYVYRGSGGAQGLYFFTDFGSDNLWTIREVDGQAVDFINRNGQLQGTAAPQFRNISSFALDGNGNLYGISLGGLVMRMDFSQAAGDGADKLAGGDGADSIYGGAGGDRLGGSTGDDLISGGLDNDRISGDAGADVLSGGRGADIFMFRTVEDSATGASDRITDLAAADVIDLRRIDADTTDNGNQAFVLVSALTGVAGQLALTYQSGPNRTLLQGDVDGDGTADIIVIIGGDKSGYDNFVL